MSGAAEGDPAASAAEPEAARGKRAGHAARWRWWIAIGLLALALRAIYLWESAESPFRHLLTLDARVYDAWAREILRGRLSPEAVFPQAPLYPAFVAGCYALLGSDPLRALLLQALLGAATAALGAHLAARLWGRIAGLATGLLLAAYQPGIFYSGVLLPPVLAAFLLLLAAALARRPFAAGIACGWTGLAQPLLLPAAWIAAAGVGARLRDGGEIARRGPSGLARGILLLLAGSAIAIAPVTLYNLLSGGALVPISANDGINLFIGNGPQATGYYVPPTGELPEGDLSGIAQASRLSGRELSAVEASRYWRNRALETMRARPGRALALALRKALAFLQAYEVPQVESLGFERRYSWLLKIPLLPGWLALLALALAAWPRARDDRAYRALLAAVVATALLGALFFVTGRFRFPLHVCLALAAGAGASDLAALARSRPPAGEASRGRRLAAAIAPPLLALLAFGPAWLPGSRPQAHGEFHYRLGQIAERDGRAQDARSEYRAALERAPGHYQAAIRLGLLEARLGEIDAARALLERGLALDPGNARGLLALAQVHQVERDLAGACSLYSRAWAADTTHLPALERLAIARFLKGDAELALEAARELARRAGPRAPLAARCAYLLARSAERERAGWPLWTTPERAEADLASAEGDRTRAEALWEQARARDPEDPVIALELARLARARGDLEAAEAWGREFVGAGGPREWLHPPDEER